VEEENAVVAAADLVSLKGLRLWSVEEKRKSNERKKD
jgi:hypothetical protein